MKEEKRVKALVFSTLAILTLTVVIYDLRFFNPPKVLWIEVWGRGDEYSEDWEVVVDITNHPLNEGIMHYVNKSIQLGEKGGFGIGERIYIFYSSEVADFFAKYSVSSWCLTCALAMSPHFKNGDTYYHVLVSYSSVRLSFLEYVMAWVVSIATIILWIYAFSPIQKLKLKKVENEEYSSQSSTTLEAFTA